MLSCVSINGQTLLHTNGKAIVNANGEAENIPIEPNQQGKIASGFLEKSNVKVYTYKGSEISLKGSGGPTCLTKPLFRKPINR